MQNTKNTKRALLSSVLALVVCIAMLVGSTFAWFTDSASTSGNTIVSGELDVALEMKENGQWVNAEGKTLKWVTTDSVDNVLWEPGCTYKLPELRVVNNGNLALKYQVVISGLEGDAELLDVIEFTGIPAEDQYVELKEKGDSEEFQIIGHMLESAGNKYMGLELSGITITVKATQLSYENDSFDNQYDVDSMFVVEVKDADELALALANNENVVLLNDIVLTGEWTPVGDKDAGIYYSGTLDGNGHTISGLTVSNGDYVALISAAKDATIKNLTVEGTVSGKNAAGIVARVEGNTVIENCVNNAAVAGTSKAGGIACNVTGADAKIIGCTNNGDITWSNESNGGVGGIVGYVNNNANLEINNCTNTGDVTSLGNTYAGAAVGYAAQYSTGEVIGMTNSGVITGSVIADGRYLEYDGTILCGFVGTVGNWVAGVMVDDTAELIEKIKTVPIGTESIIYLADGTYDGNIDITIAALGKQYGDVVIKAAEGAEPVITGTVTIGLYENRTFNVAKWEANVTFEGITFDQAASKTHCLNVQALNSLTLKNCTIIGDGEYGINSASGNPTGESLITECKFVNAAIQGYGNFCSGLVIDKCTFEDSRVNIGAGNGVTVQNCKFDYTVTDANVDDSFYLVRTSSTGTPITVKDCEITVDSTVTGVASSQAKWAIFHNRHSSKAWTIENVEITMTAAALAQPEIVVIKTAGGAMNTTNVTVNGTAIS